MKDHAKAAIRGSSGAGGRRRGLLGGAFAIRGSLRDGKGSGARAGRPPAVILVTLALAVGALAAGAAPASAEPPVLTMGTVSNVLGASAHVTGTVDPADEDTYTLFQYSTNPAGGEWIGGPESYFHILPAGSGPTGVSEDLAGLQPETTYFVRVGAARVGSPDAFSPEPYVEFTTAPVAAPTIISIEDASEITNHAAKLSASVERPAGDDPALDITCTFEYITDEQFEANEDSSLPGFEGASQDPCDKSPIEAADPSPTAVTAHPSDLESNTTYHLRLTVFNAGGSDVAVASTFKTDSQVALQTLSAGTIDEDTATLAGRINPDNSPVTYRFEWGLQQGEGDETYENVAPAAAEPLGAADTSFHFLTVPLNGLSAATVYHFRITASNTQTGEELFGQDQTFTTRATSSPPISCPNESSRVGPSAALPDCRAYEWASPGLNGAIPYGDTDKQVLADGTGYAFTAFGNAPLDAESSEVLHNRLIGQRSSGGWSVRSTLPPTPVMVGGYTTAAVPLLSEDFSESVSNSTQPLAGPIAPGDAGVNFFLRRADNSFVQLTNTASGGGPWFDECCKASRDFTHIFYSSANKQLPSDPSTSNLYQWSGGDLSLVGVLPNGELAPGGAALAEAALPAVSDDGAQVLFLDRTNSNPSLYLREHGENTVDVSATQRIIDPDPNPPAHAKAVGISSDGSEVLFTSASELTNDANTGETAGEANGSGSDLYSYDVESGKLTDLSVDENPLDAASGADVESFREIGGGKEMLVWPSADATYIYFIAKGKLSLGAISGEENLYVEHDGDIDFITTVQPDQFGRNKLESFHVTPDGRHAAFITTDPVTGYDNAGQAMAYKYTYKGALECASCRPSGEPPTSGARFGQSGGAARPLSDDGDRLFFESTDAILPQASNGLSNVYEFEDGELHLLSPGDGVSSDAHLLGASASGDDVFIEVFDELSVQGQDSKFGIYDARIGADVIKPAPSICQGEDCRGSSTSPPSTPGSGTPNFSGPLGIGASRAKAAKGRRVRLRVIVPEAGVLQVSGRGLKAFRKQVSEQGSLTLMLAIKPAANSKRIHKGSFRTTGNLLFTSATGNTSRVEVSLKFEAPAIKKDGK